MATLDSLEDNLYNTRVMKILRHECALSARGQGREKPRQTAARRQKKGEA